jgi:hypothetical protein
MNKKFLWVVAALIAVGVAGLYLQQRNDVATGPAAVAELPPEPMNEPQPIIRDEPAVEPVADAPVVEQVPLPALSESDDEARATASELAPKLAAWLKPTEQIRKWVVAIDLAADGVLMEKNRPLAYPMSAFKVTGEEGDYRPDAANFGRTGELIDTVTAIPPARLAALYRSWRPLFEEAYRELGKPGSFDARLKLAIDRALAVEPLAGTPTLVRPKVYYRYADPKLERASDIDKLLWRMGPDNSARLQAWLTELRAAL